RRDRRRPPEADTLRALDGERFLRPLPDQAPLELSERRQHVCHRLARRRRGVDGAVEGDERPALGLRLRHHDCFGSKRWPSTTAEATSVSFRFVERACSRSISKAVGSSTEWRSMRMPFARSVTARRPKAPSRSWYSVKRRKTMSIELCQSFASASVM